MADDGFLDSIQVASPCRASWEAMTGDDRARFCAACRLHVYDLTGLTRREAEDLIARKEGRVCVRFFRRADGTVLTRDCPAAFRRAARWTVAVCAGLVGLFVAGMTHATGRGSWGSWLDRLTDLTPTRSPILDVSMGKPVRSSVATTPHRGSVRGPGGPAACVLVRVVDADVPPWFEASCEVAEIEASDERIDPAELFVSAGQPIAIRNGGDRAICLRVRAEINELRLWKLLPGQIDEIDFCVPEDEVTLEIDGTSIVVQIHVLPHPFFAVTRPDGSFSLEAPPGARLEVWPDPAGYSIELEGAEGIEPPEPFGG